MAPEAHNMEEMGFSTTQGVPRCAHHRTTLHVKSRNLLPAMTFALSTSARSASPSRWLASRKGPHAEPRGPWRARDQLLQGVAIHTVAAAPEEIHPWTTWRTTGRSTSCQSPWSESSGTEEKPNSATAFDNPPVPAKSSKKTKRFRRVASATLDLKSACNRRRADVSVIG